MLREAADRGVHLTFICSKGDPRLRDLREAGGEELKGLCAQGKVACDVIPRSDHTFSSLHDQETLIDAILKRTSTAAADLQQQARMTATVSNTAKADLSKIAINL